LSRFFDLLLAPLYRLLRYRGNLDIDTFLQQANLELLESKPANLFGYSAVLVCRSHVVSAQKARQTEVSFNPADADISLVYSWIKNSQI
jgi:hypothetical protein